MLQHKDHLLIPDIDRPWLVNALYRGKRGSNRVIAISNSNLLNWSVQLVTN